LLAPAILAQEQPADVESLVRKAMEAYRAGRKQEAVDLLTKAANLIQKENERGLVAFVPAAPQGWKREEVQSSSGTWGSGEAALQWTQADAQYLEEGKEEPGVRIILSSSPMLVDGHKDMVEQMKNDQFLAMMNQDPNRSVKRFSRDGWAGCITAEKGGATTLVALKDKLVCQIEVPGGDAKVLDRFAALVDWPGLAGAVR
jgi:hypothetical protein